MIVEPELAETAQSYEAREEELMVAITGSVAVTGEGAAASSMPQAPAVGYLRGGDVAVIVPRLVTQFREQWRDVYVVLPDGMWRNNLTQETIPGGRVPLGDLLGKFPVALLERG